MNFFPLEKFKNNMVSYVGDRIIDSALSAPNTAFFESVPTLDYSEEYQSCQVFKIFALCYVIFYSIQK